MENEHSISAMRPKSFGSFIQVKYMYNRSPFYLFNYVLRPSVLKSKTYSSIHFMWSIYRSCIVKYNNGKGLNRSRDRPYRVRKYPEALLFQTKYVDIGALIKLAYKNQQYCGNAENWTHYTELQINFNRHYFYYFFTKSYV